MDYSSKKLKVESVFRTKSSALFKLVEEKGEPYASVSTPQHQGVVVDLSNTTAVQSGEPSGGDLSKFSWTSSKFIFWSFLTTFLHEIEHDVEKNVVFLTS